MNSVLSEQGELLRQQTEKRSLTFSKICSLSSAIRLSVSAISDSVWRAWRFRCSKQLNHVTKQWFQTMKALHQIIMQKARDFIGRIYDRVAGGVGYSGKAGRDSGTGGKPADRNRTM